MTNNDYINQLKRKLQGVSSKEKARAMQRFFPDQVSCIGVKAPDIKQLIADFHEQHSALDAEQLLTISDALLKKAQYNQEVLLAFGLITKFVKGHYSDDLLHKFKYWLENFATNWAHVDDLCIKNALPIFTKTSSPDPTNTKLDTQ